MVMPAPLLTAVKKVQDTVLICPPVISQYAATGALTAGVAWCRQQIEPFNRVRHLVLDELEKLSAFCRVPHSQGALYFLLQIDTELDPLVLVERLIRDFGVAVIPGTTFGINSGCYLRISYGALDADMVATGVGRLITGLRTRQRLTVNA